MSRLAATVLPAIQAMAPLGSCPGYGTLEGVIRYVQLYSGFEADVLYISLSHGRGKGYLVVFRAICQGASGVRIKVRE